MDNRSDFRYWYPNLKKPKWTPPSAVFGPVWGILYSLMAISVVLLLANRENRDITLSLIIFSIQLVLNAGWVWIFFGLHRIGLAFLEIVVLWTAILLSIIAFWNVSPLSAVLLLPYLLWVLFAAALNFSLWRLNP